MGMEPPQHEKRDERLNVRVSKSFLDRLERLATRETERRGVEVGVSWVARWLMERAIGEAENNGRG